ncbi:MAG TPA: alpha-hydroxy acid oxidase [Deferrisomatales bacterium]|nr:alpha-hydroxy acid oxidase [Deferrisomatales bacterium]
MRTIQEILLQAHRMLPAEMWDHVSGGAESETTLRRNRQALDRVAFRPRVLRDVSRIETSTTFLGRELRIPVFWAPIGGAHVVREDAARVALDSASEYGVVSCLSSINQLSLEAAARTQADDLIFQLYLQGGGKWVDDYLDRVHAARPRAFCLTVDTALYSRRERDMVNQFAPSGREQGEREGFEAQAMMTWGLVEKVRRRLDVPVILKGIQTAEDARLAVEHGVDVVYVSNHGGRQLDHGPGCMDVLPEIVSAVDGRAEVVVDGGFVRGTDILKAVASGARAVGLGKLQVWALAAAGRQGLVRALEILEEELRVSMGLLGVTRLDQLDGSYLQAASPAGPPDWRSPFPSLMAALGERPEE